VNGQGRYAYEWVLPWGLRERVLCDGQTLWHFYPELLVGTRRPVSRFHRAEFTRLVPWMLPPVEELARGADLVWIDDRTVAIVPHQRDVKRGADGKRVAPSQVQLVLGADGQLAERRLVEMPSRKTLQRETYDNGVVRRLDAHGKDISVRRLTVQARQAP